MLRVCDLELGVFGESARIHVGRVNLKRTDWLKKPKDVHDSFLTCVVQMFLGKGPVRLAPNGKGKVYEIVVREVQEKQEEEDSEHIAG